MKMRFTISDDKFLLNHPVSSTASFFGGTLINWINAASSEKCLTFCLTCFVCPCIMLQPKTTETTGVYVWKKAIYQPPYELSHCLWYSIYSCIWYLYTHPFMFHWCPACISPGLEGSAGPSICTANKQGEPVTARVVTTSHPLSPPKQIQKLLLRHPRPQDLLRRWVFGSPKCIIQTPNL